MPVVESFAPDWLIISAGFDAHRDDPLAGIELTSADYADFARRLAALVPTSRLLVVLEGGYDLDALTHSVGTTLGAARWCRLPPKRRRSARSAVRPSSPPVNSGS